MPDVANIQRERFYREFCRAGFRPRRNTLCCYKFKAVTEGVFDYIFHLRRLFGSQLKEALSKISSGSHYDIQVVQQAKPDNSKSNENEQKNWMYNIALEESHFFLSVYFTLDDTDLNKRVVTVSRIELAEKFNTKLKAQQKQAKKEPVA